MGTRDRRECRASVANTVVSFATLGISAACGSASGQGAPPPATDAGADDVAVLSGDGSFADESDASRDRIDGDSSREGGSEFDSPVDASGVHFIGRFDVTDPAGPRFAWPGSAIATTFTGTGIDVTLRDEGQAGNFFSVVIDGGQPSVLSTSYMKSSYTLASNLAATSHTVIISKKTESSAGVVQFLGFTPHNGAIVRSPDLFTRAIEFVGDSITCGYGDLGVGPACHESSAVEDETISYAALTAAQLNASQTVIAYSGIGVYRDYGGSTADQMPARFTRTLADDPMSVWPFTAPAPDVVVVNLGTNDFHSADGGNPDPGAPFQTAYLTFIKQLRAEYPKAGIICTLSPMLGDPSRSQARTYIEGAVTQLGGAGDRRVAFLEFASQEASNGYGCDYHPSAKTHQIMAAALVPAISAMTGW